MLDFKQKSKNFYSGVKKYFNTWKWWEFAWISLSLIVILTLSIIYHDNAISIICSLTGCLSVFLCAKGKTDTYYFGIIQVCLYATICFYNSLFANFAIYMFFFLPCQFIGIYLWKKHMNSKNTVVAKNMKWVYWIIGIIALAVLIVSTAFVLNIFNNDLLKSFLDSASSIILMTAMVLMMLRYIEQWVLWIIGDILTIALWTMTFISTDGGDIAILIMAVIMSANAIYGFINWTLENKRAKANRL